MLNIRLKSVAIMCGTVFTLMVSSAYSQELKIAVTSENTSLASHQSGSEVNSPGLRNIFEVLVARDTETNELMPELATSWSQINPSHAESSKAQVKAYGS